MSYITDLLSKSVEKTFTTSKKKKKDLDLETPGYEGYVRARKKKKKDKYREEKDHASNDEHARLVLPETSDNSVVEYSIHKKKKRGKEEEAPAPHKSNLEPAELVTGSDLGQPTLKKTKNKHRLREEDATLPPKHVETYDLNVGSCDEDPITKKKKKKHRLKEEDETMPQEHVEPPDPHARSDEGDPIRKKKKKKHRLREEDETMPQEHAETSEVHALSDDVDPIHKKKKKKHRLREEDVTMPQEHVEPSDIHTGSDDGDLIPKKKKKKHRLREEEATAPINVISFIPSEALAGSNDGDPVLKKKKKNRCTEEKMHEPESALRKCVLIDQMDESSDGVSILKKKIPKKLLSKEFMDEEINEKSSESESDEQKKINKDNIIEDGSSNKKQNSIINDIIGRVLKENRKRNSSGEAQGDTSTLITDICSPSCPDKTTGELFNVVTYIMKENIPISKQNTHNCKPTAVPSTSRLHSFTEEEDMQIRTRFKFLVDNHVVKKPKVLLQQLEEQASHVGRQEKDKTVSDIVGLYVGQDLHNRLAHSVTQRLLFLLTGSSLENRIDIKKTKEELVYKITQKSRGWSLDEDKILIKNVLTNDRNNANPGGVSLVQDIVEKEVNWEKVFKSLEEYGRNLMRVRERWNRHVKGFLLEEEQSPEDRQEYLAELAKHVLGMGVKDKKEIKWKAVAPYFHPKTTQMLSEDFWSLTKRSRGDTLTQKLENSLEFLRTAHSQNLSKVNHKKKNDKVLQLRDYYASLLDSCKSEPSI